jgi:hypothetical protein
MIQSNEQSLVPPLYASCFVQWYCQQNPEQVSFCVANPFFGNTQSNAREQFRTLWLRTIHDPVISLNHLQQTIVLLQLLICQNDNTEIEWKLSIAYLFHNTYPHILILSLVSRQSRNTLNNELKPAEHIREGVRSETWINVSSVFT